MPSNSLVEFVELLGSVDQLITIQGKLQQGPGRRHEQDAIHRAGVVLTVAAWQAYVEKVLREGLQELETYVTAPVGGTAPPPWATTSFFLRKAAIEKRISEFNTPNSQNVQRQFTEAFGFDPWPSWSWHVSQRNWSPSVFRTRTDAWLKIRHSIAHGFDLPQNMNWIKGDNGNPRLTLGLLRECRKHFNFLAARTDQAFSDFLQVRYGMQAPW